MRPLVPLFISSSLLLATFATSGCTKSVFDGNTPDRRPETAGKDVKKGGRSPNEIDASCKEGTPGCIPSDKKTNLNIKIVRLNSESWWKNCVSVGVFVDGFPTQQGYVSIGCNKDSVVGSEKALIGHKERCNVIRVLHQTFENQGESCNSNPNAPCNGPYGSSPTREKSSARAGDRKFFEVFDARSLSLVFGIPSFANLVSPSDLALKESAKGSSEINGWLRIFIEDQPQTNLASWIAGRDFSSVNRKRLGIDYDDYVFDIQSRGGAKIAVDGENLFTDPKPGSFVAPPGCTN